jgi:hypothetical protein
MFSIEDQRLVRAAISTHQWLKSHRAPRGGGVLKKSVERSIGECLIALDREGYVSEANKSDLLTSLAAFSEYLEYIRSH